MQRQIMEFGPIQVVGFVLFLLHAQTDLSIPPSFAVYWFILQGM